MKTLREMMDLIESAQTVAEASPVDYTKFKLARSGGQEEKYTVFNLFYNGKFVGDIGYLKADNSWFVGEPTGSVYGALQGKYRDNNRYATKDQALKALVKAVEPHLNLVMEWVERSDAPWKTGEYPRVLSAIELYYPRFSIEELVDDPRYHKVIADKAGVAPELVKAALDEFDPRKQEQLDEIQDASYHKVEEDSKQTMSVKDILAYLKKVMGTASHQDWRNHIINNNDYFVLKNLPVNSLKSDLAGLDKTAVEKYKQMDFSKAPPIVIGSDGNILDGYHRVNVAKALGIPTIKGYVGIKKQQAVTENNSRYRVVLTLHDDSASPDETARRKIAINVSATDEQSAIKLAKQKLIKSPQYDGSRIVNAQATQHIAQEEVDEDASPDAVRRIEQLVQYK